MTGRRRAVEGTGARFRTALLIGLGVAAVVGFYFGIQTRAAEGYECGPIANLGRVFWPTVTVALSALILIACGVAALTRHKRAAIACLGAVGALAIGFGVGYVLGTPIDRCERPTSKEQPAGSVSARPARSATPVRSPTAFQTPKATHTPETSASRDASSLVWRDEPNCLMFDIARVTSSLETSHLYAAGRCTTGDSTQTAMAWRSIDGGFQWQRVLPQRPGTEAFGVADDGLGTATVVGMDQDRFLPLVWEQAPDAYSAVELPNDGMPGLARDIARGPNSTLIVGTTFPDGSIEGRTRGAAWLKVGGEPGWTIVEAPRDALGLIGVTYGSVVGGGAGYTIAGFTSTGASTIWNVTLDREWERIALPGGTDDEIQELIDFRAAVARRTLWTYEGNDWRSASLGDNLEARTGIRLESDGQELGFYVAGERTPQLGGAAFLLHTRDGQAFVELPQQPDYVTASLHGMSLLDDRLIGVGDAVYTVPMPEI